MDIRTHLNGVVYIYVTLEEARQMIRALRDQQWFSPMIKHFWLYMAAKAVNARGYVDDGLGPYPLHPFTDIYFQKWLSIQLPKNFPV